MTVERMANRRAGRLGVRKAARHLPLWFQRELYMYPSLCRLLNDMRSRRLLLRITRTHYKPRCCVGKASRGRDRARSRLVLFAKS